MNTLLNNQPGETCCVICEQYKWKGIYLYTSFICSDCEKSIISTETNDPQYKFYLKKLRKINAPEIYS
ncbi:sigma factor G inhibitor Gin [Robertmurraya sp. DFI.2.37]|uniref:sigma factor G inhibitor Gin n=1 Tax=Robertmurraya sp. DFI.2.37 TaxID=3031819 RepID=UPI001245B392|nr:sigma factor G inhibitor Gin [Robertmurraya sp. DFI.2.37]MDF1509499.1 sigma factor G inhibitor Gin [Robertmurraya sp. DFI.2.37]